MPFLRFAKALARRMRGGFPVRWRGAGISPLDFEAKRGFGGDLSRDAGERLLVNGLA